MSEWREHLLIAAIVFPLEFLLFVWIGYKLGREIQTNCGFDCAQPHQNPEKEADE